jgi:hypothetical protein
MPLQRTEHLFGLVCSHYENGVVKVGTNAQRISLRIKADEPLLPKLRAALIKGGLRTKEELPEDYAAAAAMPAQPLQQPQPQPQPQPQEPQLAELTVLLGASRCKLPPVRQGDRSETVRLSSDLGKAWEIDQPSRAEAELKQISSTNDKLLHERRAAKQESVKRSRDEEEALAARKDPCLCTREGAATLLKEAHQLTRDTAELATRAAKAAGVVTNCAFELMMAKKSSK